MQAEIGAEPTAGLDGTPALDLGLYGGPLDTGNLGVSALGLSMVRGLSMLAPGVRLTLFDHGVGTRALRVEAGPWSADLECVGSAFSRRLYRPSNQQQALLAARLGLADLHPFTRRLRRLDAVLDISGGDSFSDIYGDWRFRAVTLPKRLALAVDRPLILMPQTYGPFEDPDRRQQARGLMRAATQLWARDARSLDVVRDVLGSDFDPTRHRSGVDVAFGLPVSEPTDAKRVERILQFTVGDAPVFGVNVSGLLYHGARADFGIRVDYPALVTELVRRLLDESGARVVLVPHVAAPCLNQEDDWRACKALRETLDAGVRDRVLVIPPFEDPMEIKWVIGRCDWFCGTRMHSCIAGLSQGVPTATLAYSDKSLGVFECVDAGDWVFDPRHDEAESLLAGVLETVAKRREMGERLARSLETIHATWHQQFRSILDAVASLRRTA